MKFVFRLSSPGPFYSLSLKSEIKRAAQSVTHQPRLFSLGQRRPQMLVTERGNAYPELGCLRERGASGRENRPRRASLWSSPNSTYCTPRARHPFSRTPSFAYSHFPWLLDQVAAARQDRRGPLTGSCVFFFLQSWSFCAFLHWVSQWSSIYLAFKSSRWINIALMWKRLMSHFLVDMQSVDFFCIKHFPSCFKSFGADGHTELYPSPDIH